MGGSDRVVHGMHDALLHVPVLLCAKIGLHSSLMGKGLSPLPLRVQVKVRRRGSDTKFVASVLSIGTECDIAM